MKQKNLLQSAVEIEKKSDFREIDFVIVYLPDLL